MTRNNLCLALALAVSGFTLFLIGAGLSREALKSVGVRPLVMGVLLWVIVSCAALAAVLAIDSI